MKVRTGFRGEWRIPGFNLLIKIIAQALNNVDRFYDNKE
jgi:hypothetical protein